MPLHAVAFAFDTHACAFSIRLCISNRCFSNRLHRKKGGLLVFMFCIIVPSILVLCGGVCFGHKIYYSCCQEGIFIYIPFSFSLIIVVFGQYLPRMLHTLGVMFHTA